jgi:hypothetical protein
MENNAARTELDYEFSSQLEAPNSEELLKVY